MPTYLLQVFKSSKAKVDVITLLSFAPQLSFNFLCTNHDVGNVFSHRSIWSGTHVRHRLNVCSGIIDINKIPTRGDRGYAQLRFEINFGNLGSLSYHRICLELCTPGSPLRHSCFIGKRFTQKIVEFRLLSASFLEASKQF